MSSPPPIRRRLWPAVLSGVLAGMLVLAAVAFFVVRRDDPTTAGATDAPLVLTDGVTAGGSVTGEARALFDALTERGLECSVRFTGAEGGHSGCFAYQRSARTTAWVSYQYRPTAPSSP
jgi:hypothetical protein